LQHLSIAGGKKFEKKFWKENLENDRALVRLNYLFALHCTDYGFPRKGVYFPYIEASYGTGR